MAVSERAHDQTTERQGEATSEERVRVSEPERGGTETAERVVGY